jgi:hypothetical protein
MKFQRIMTTFSLGLVLAASVAFAALPADTYAAGTGLVPCGTSYSADKVCTLCHLVLGVQGVIQWGMRVMTFIALAVITAMGILYIVSAGDKGMMGTAKGGIKASLIGFALMLGGWLIINFIITSLAPNLGVEKGGNWYTFKCSTYSKTGGGAYSGTGTVPVGDPGDLTCSSGSCAKKTEVVEAVKRNASGVDPNLVMAIIDGGEGCNKSKSPAGACGYSQVIDGPKYYLRSKVCGIPGGPTQTCTAIQSNLQIDINCGSKLIKDDFMRRCGTDVRSVASCYNTGNKNKCGKRNYCERVASYYNSCPK